MTLLLGLVAAIFLIAFIVIVGMVLSQNRNDQVPGFHPPQGLIRPADAIRSAAPGPRPIDNIPLAQIMAGGAVIPQSSPNAFYPGNLGLGTLLTYRGITSEIVGVISFDFNGEVWQDYMASNDTGRWWRLGVEPDRGMKLAAFEPRELPIEPGPETLDFDGSTYAVTDSGPARYRTLGETNQFEEGKYYFYDYENASGIVLSYEKFDNGPWITSVGHNVDPSQVEVNNAPAQF